MMDVTEMTREERALERQEWIAEAVEVLIDAPYSWPADHARSYAEAISETYLDEGFTPEQAIEEDSLNWD